MKSKCIGYQQDESLGVGDIFHSNNREWLQGQLVEAEEDIKARRVFLPTKHYLMMLLLAERLA